jgi:hypothetical protein
MVIDSGEVSSNDIGSFIERLSKHKNIHSIRLTFNPLIFHISVIDNGLSSVNDVVNCYVNWQGENQECICFDVEIE